MTTRYMRLVTDRPPHTVDPTPAGPKRKPHGTAKRERQQRCALTELASLWHPRKDTK